MGALTLFLKLMPYIWPFLREMVLGRKSFLEALRDNKKKALFITLVIFSFGLNFVLVPRSSTLAMEYLALERKYKELEAAQKGASSTPKHPVAQSKEVSAKEPTPVKVAEPVLEEHTDSHGHVAVLVPKVRVPKKLKIKPLKIKPVTAAPKEDSTHLAAIKAHYEEIRKREERNQ